MYLSFYLIRVFYLQRCSICICFKVTAFMLFQTCIFWGTWRYFEECFNLFSPYNESQQKVHKRKSYRFGTTWEWVNNCSYLFNSLGKISLTAEVEQHSALLYFWECALGLGISLFYVSDLCLTNKPALFFLSLTLPWHAAAIFIKRQDWPCWTQIGVTSAQTHSIKL